MKSMSSQRGAFFQDTGCPWGHHTVSLLTALGQASLEGYGVQPTVFSTIQVSLNFCLKQYGNSITGEILKTKHVQILPKIQSTFFSMFSFTQDTKTVRKFSGTQMTRILKTKFLVRAQECLLLTISKAKKIRSCIFTDGRWHVNTIRDLGPSRKCHEGTQKHSSSSTHLALVVKDFHEC